MGSGIAPGDVACTFGKGIVSWCVRRSGSYSHSLVFHELLESYEDGSELWATVEAWPALRRTEDGVRWRTRLVAPPEVGQAFKLAVFRPWRTPAEQYKVLLASAAWAAAGLRYDWLEIVRILLYGIGVKLPRWWRDNAYKAICSHHVAAVVVAARPDLALEFPVPPTAVWPGLLAAVCVTAPSVSTIPPYSPAW